MLEAMSIELSSGGGFTGDTVGVFIIFSSAAFFTGDTLWSLKSPVLYRRGNWLFVEEDVREKSNAVSELVGEVGWEEGGEVGWEGGAGSL